MNNKYLDDVLPFLTSLPQERREKFYKYFQNAPLWLIDSFVVERLPKGTVFIREGDDVDRIYFIASGIIKAMDRRVYGISFDFMIFTDVYAYGGMEVIMDLDKYKTSLKTVTDCTVLKIPKSHFAKWLKSDVTALGHEAKLMAGYLLEQARNIRLFLFLEGADRVSMLLTMLYEQYAPKGILKLDYDRQEFSDMTGLSIKTITRSINKLRDDALITKTGRSLSINNVQYHQLKDNLASILTDD